MITASTITWRSSYSGPENACVELVESLDQLRDSKNPNGRMLTADVPALLAAIKTGRFDA